jgi:hypothetical protein
VFDFFRPEMAVILAVRVFRHLPTFDVFLSADAGEQYQELCCVFPHKDNQHFLLSA